MIVDADRVVGLHGVFSPGRVVIDEETGLIVECGTRVATDVRPATHTAPIVVPGLVDIHNHGVGGTEDVATTWTNPEHSLARLGAAGTTSVLASLTFPQDEMHRLQECLTAIHRVVGRLDLGCVLAGIHAEGPVVATLGALPASDRLAAAPLEDFVALCDQIGPSLRVMTIAPSLEAPRNYERIKYLLAHSVQPALGHDALCTEEDIVGALRLGDRMHITHAFNAQKFHHRDSGLANFALLRRLPALPLYEGCLAPTCELIVDNVHVSPAVVQAVLDVHGNDSHVCCVTDAIAEPIAGTVLSYAQSDRRVQVDSEGTAVRLCDGSGRLCGSCTTLFETFQRLVRIYAQPLEHAVAACATTPARIARLLTLDSITSASAGVGALVVGCRGDLLLLDDSLSLQSVFVAGKLI